MAEFKERNRFGEGFGRGPLRPRSEASRENDRQAKTRRIASTQQTQCRFCRRGQKHVDYKDVDTLQKLLTHRGKIYSRKRSGNCAGCQRKVKRAIKHARYMALLPFTA